MRRTPFAIGLISLVTGVVFLLSLNISYQESEFVWETVLSETNVWQISYNFTEGDKVKLFFAPGHDWGKYVEPPIPDVPIPHKFAYINITDPYGHGTLFEATLAAGQTLGLYNVTAISSNGFRPLDLQEEKGIVGETVYTGRYKAEVAGFLPPGGSSPAVLKFLKESEVINTKYPYKSYLYPGVAMLLLGIASLFWSVKAPRRRHPRRRGKHARKS